MSEEIDHEGNAVAAMQDIIMLSEKGQLIEFSCSMMAIDGVFRGAVRYGEGQGFMRFYGPDSLKQDVAAQAIGDRQLNELFKAAQAHGEKSEPAHEIGDLKDMLRACWHLMGPVARTEIFDGFHELREVWRDG